MRPNAHQAAVLGSPIAHSLSPLLHRAAYARLGLARWSYGRHEVDEAGLAGFLDGLDESWAGLSLTMPLKRAVIPLLDGIADTARAVNAVNTLVFGPDGSRHGENTDVPGLAAALRERGVQQVAAAAVLGGGATAGSTLAALAGLVHGPIAVYARTPAKVAEFAPLAEHFGLELQPRPWSQAREATEYELVVNTTPAGVADELAEDLPVKVGTLFDVIYHPWPTRLAEAWTRRGAVVLGGRDLLLHQAVTQVELMTGVHGRAGDILDAMRTALAARD
ncbi:shikimate dehydrogenase [Actinospica durhamensis]|uniref:Shikimate dehydrogenase n=1 Tax=Actinospica durhamensis TaxID=1508375 RepID=A0A941EHD0_9ACTN|nr:shikimate dehydrogenase [Actinospica durhamensis]